MRNLKKKSIDIAIITEIKKKLKGTKDIEDFVMKQRRVSQTKRVFCGCVAILVAKKWRNKIVNYTYINEHIIILRIRIKRSYLSSFRVYALEEGIEKKRLNCFMKNFSID